ncbi:MAG: hypothetical protein FWD54_03010 [Endomicrobia bacterium]|nr:hypothetical protein [Endomicrobiia bacterium]MCL2799234.1 hypothetical protein [Endomicrobiia bacterium]
MSIIIVSFMILPCFVKGVDAESAVRLCVNSGILGYYNSISKAAFDMTHKVLQDIGVSVGQHSKKEAPVKKEAKQNNEVQAVVLDNVLKKFIKTALFFTPVFYETVNDFNKSAVSINFDYIFAGWMLFFVLMCIFSIRKKDNCEVSLNYYISRRPIVV